MPNIITKDVKTCRLQHCQTTAGFPGLVQQQSRDRTTVFHHLLQSKMLKLNETQGGSSDLGYTQSVILNWYQCETGEKIPKIEQWYHLVL